MKDQKFKIRRFIELNFLSFFGVGYSPIVPGTVGSIATLPLIFLVSHWMLTFNQVLIATFFLFILACLIADKVQKQEKVHDPGWIVIDEVIGMLVTWLFVFPSTKPIDLLLVLITFRFFDIVKIYPANWFDTEVTNGIGTIIDDVISAIYAGITIIGVKYFLTIL
jgi:phosphatidylglycerophosphatase A